MNKIKINFSKEINWLFCNHCGHAVYGTKILTVKGWPIPVSVPKPRNSGRKSNKKGKEEE